MATRRNAASMPMEPTDMPHELILVILEWAARIWIDVHPRWTVSLQLVSHAAQTAIKPIVYRVFTVQTSEALDSEGQWGQTLDALRLVQILKDDTPRIHHLILGLNTLETFRDPHLPTRSVPRLSIVSPRSTTLPKYFTKTLKVTSASTEVIYYGRVQVKYMRVSTGRARFWGSEAIWVTAMPTYDFIVIDAPVINLNRQDVAASDVTWLYLELGEWMKLSMLVLYDIAEILLSTRSGLSNAHVVIACPVDYISPWGLGADETLQLLDASRTLPGEDRTSEEQWCVEQQLSVALEPRQFRMLRRSRVDPDVLYSRVHVSHALWGCNGPGWPGLWYGRAVERGDAWDEGRQLRQFVEPGSVQSL